MNFRTDIVTNILADVTVTLQTNSEFPYIINNNNR